jgi:uncharacterized protein
MAMLISFSVENFRSFKDVQTFNLLASRADDKSLPHSQAVPGTHEHVLRIASLYGANGAGKSNLVRAMSTLEDLVINGVARDKRMPYKPFLFDKESSSKPTVFDVQFIAEGEVFRYGICYDAERVHEEWLDVCYGKREENLFSRTYENDKVIIEFNSSSKCKIPESIKSLATSGIRINQPFFAEVADRYNETKNTLFEKAIGWFLYSLSIISPDSSFSSLAKTLSSDPNFTDFICTFMHNSDIGIDKIKVDIKKYSLNELPPLPIQVKKMVDNLSDGNSFAFGSRSGEEYIIDASEKDFVKYFRLFTLHKTSDKSVDLPFIEESDGSQRLLNLLPALYMLRDGGHVFIIDELERSMHPMLAKKFVEYFLNSKNVADNQLFFTTHESHLLDLELQQRGGIWFVEKDDSGSSRLGSLADYNVRKDLDIEKGYFSGRFGAIPFLGGIDRLMEQSQEAVMAEGNP